jgi:hypothetical protein
VKFLFDDEAFSFEALRVTGSAPYGGADLGEVLVTARQIPDGDEAAWHQCWKNLAERLHAAGTDALRAGSTTYVNVAVWESAQSLGRAFSSPQFQALLARYPDTSTAAPHLFTKVAVPGICLG